LKIADNRTTSELCFGLAFGSAHVIYKISNVHQAIKAISINLLGKRR
jgi:hypothetical protein